MIYLKFKTAKTAIVGVMTTPARLTRQFRIIATSYCHFTINYLCERLNMVTRMHTKRRLKNVKRFLTDACDKYNDE